MVDVIIDAAVVIFERASVPAEYGVEEQRRIRAVPQSLVIPYYLVGHIHILKQPGELRGIEHTWSAAAGRQQPRGKDRRGEICRDTQSHPYLSWAPKSFWKQVSSLLIILSVSSSVSVFSLSWMTKLSAYCFLPSGILSPR